MKLSPEANESSWGVGRELKRSDRKRGNLTGDRWSRSPFGVFYDIADTGCIESNPWDDALSVSTV